MWLGGPRRARGPSRPAAGQTDLAARRRARLGHGLVGPQRDERVELGVDLLDARERRRHQLARLELAPADHSGQFVSRLPMELVHCGYSCVFASTILTMPTPGVGNACGRLRLTT